MKIKFLFLLLGLSAMLHAQQNNSANSAFGLFVGKKYFQNSFYNELSTLNNPAFTLPVNCVGLGASGAILTGRSASYYGHMALLYIVPQNVVVDTILKGKISGFVFSYSLFGWDLFPNSQNFDLVFSGGMNTGRLRIINNELLRQKNGLLAPMLSLAPSIKVGKIKLTLNLQYDYDVSKSGWKKTWFADKNNKAVIAPFRQSGVSALICVGWMSGK